MRFKDGDKVRITKPDNTEEYPEWIEEMDEWDGNIQVIECVAHDGSARSRTYYMYESEYEYSEVWLTRAYPKSKEKLPTIPTLVMRGGVRL